MTEQSEQPQYSSALVQLLYSRFLPRVEEAALAHPIGKMFWKAIAPQIPDYLKQLDEDKELQKSILRELRVFMAYLEEENKEEEGKGETPSD